MGQAKYRAQILLEPEQHKALAEVASRENRSISDVVREIVREWLVTQDLEAQRQRELQALEELTQIRLKIREKHGIYPGNLVEEVRAESDAENDGTPDNQTNW
jgi:Arc/MetJ-type ribon-helix-helix transcriptional regulator